MTLSPTCSMMFRLSTWTRRTDSQDDPTGTDNPSVSAKKHRRRHTIFGIASTTSQNISAEDGDANNTRQQHEHMRNSFSVYRRPTSAKIETSDQKTSQCSARTLSRLFRRPRPVSSDAYFTSDNTTNSGQITPTMPKGKCSPTLEHDRVRQQLGSFNFSPAVNKGVSEFDVTGCGDCNLGRPISNSFTRRLNTTNTRCSECGQSDRKAEILSDLRESRGQYRFSPQTLEMLNWKHKSHPSSAVVARSHAATAASSSSAFFPSATPLNPNQRSPLNTDHLGWSKRLAYSSLQSTSCAVDLVHQPHPFGIWHSNRIEPTSLPYPPFRSASGSFAQQGDLAAPSARQHTRNAHSLGDISDIIAKLPLDETNRREAEFLFADVNTTGFPLIMPGSDTEATSTPKSELASLHMSRTRSEVGSSMTEADQTPSAMQEPFDSRDMSDGTYLDDASLLGLTRPESTLSAISRQFPAVDTDSALHSSKEASLSPTTADASHDMTHENEHSGDSFIRSHTLEDHPLPTTDQPEHSEEPTVGPEVDRTEDADIPFEADHTKQPSLHSESGHVQQPHVAQAVQEHDKASVSHEAGETTERQMAEESHQSNDVQVAQEAAQREDVPLARDTEQLEDQPVAQGVQLEDVPKAFGLSAPQELAESQDMDESVPMAQDASLVQQAGDAEQPADSLNESVASSPIMKLRSLDTGHQAATTSQEARVDEPADASAGSIVELPQDRTESRISVAGSSASRNISTPATMPLSQFLRTTQPNVPSESGRRAESELGHVRSPKTSFFPSRSSAQFSTMSAQDRSDLLQGKGSDKSGGFVRRLIRRVSLKGRSQPSSGSNSLVTSPSMTSTTLPAELELKEASELGIAPMAQAKGVSRRTSLGRRRRSRDGTSARQLRTSSFFSPFRARDPDAQRRRASLGTSTAAGQSVSTRKGPVISAPLAHTSGDAPAESAALSPDMAPRSEYEEFLQSPPQQHANQLGERDDLTPERTLSQSTDRTDTGAGVSAAIAANNQFNFQDSLGLNGLAASNRQQFESADHEATRSISARSLGPSSDDAASKAAQPRPKVGIPRMWQGIDPADNLDELLAANSDSDEDLDYRAPDYDRPASKFETVTSSSSFRTAASSFDSPRHGNTRRTLQDSKGSKRSLRTLDTPLARHFDQSPMQDSPLADLISNLGKRISDSAMAAGPPVYQESTAAPSSNLRLHRSIDSLRESDVSPPLTETEPSYPTYAEPRTLHIGSNSALVETVFGSRHASWMARSEDGDESINTHIHADSRGVNAGKRDTFGGALPSSANQSYSGTTSKTLGDDSQYLQGSMLDHTPEGEVEDEEEERIVLPEVKVSEIEDHLAVVEAALQDSRQAGSFDPTHLRKSMTDMPFQQANASSASILSRESIFLPAQSHADQSVGDVSMPGEWTSGTPYGLNDDDKRITLAPDSYDALADAVRSVRKAISSSQLDNAAENPKADASRSVDITQPTDTSVSTANADRSVADHGEMSMLSEATPARAAKRRQEGMRDIEEAYSRMIALVQWTAMGAGASPSPMMRAEESRDGGLLQKHDLLSPNVDSPLAKPPNLAKESLREPQRPHSATLSSLMGMPLSGPTKLSRQASATSESSTLEAMRNLGDPDSSRDRSSGEHVGGRASSGAGHTSPSITTKTLGTPRSYNTSVSQQTFGNILRRHDLEKESLLDSLERSRTDVSDLQTQNESLTADLHAEVTRVLELERELERRDAREMKLIGRIQDLENEILELRYLDQHLNADRTADSDEAEGSIMDIELPTSLLQRNRIDQWTQSSGRQDSSPPLAVKAGSLAQSFARNPTHRSVRSEAFLSGFNTAPSGIAPSRSEQVFTRPVSLVNGPAGLTRGEDRGSDRSSTKSPLTTPRSSSLLRPSRSGRNTQTSSLLQGSLSDEGSDWKLADAPTSAAGDHEASAVAPSTVDLMRKSQTMSSLPTRNAVSPPASRIVSAGRYNSGLPRPTSVVSKLGLAPAPVIGANGSDSTSARVTSSRLPRLGSKGGPTSTSAANGAER